MDAKFNRAFLARTLAEAEKRRAEGVACKRCGKTGLRWKQVSDGWQLYDDLGAHHCKQTGSWSAGRFRSG